MANFYFTYGKKGYPFYGGWTMISAPNLEVAVATFRAYHPDRHPGLPDCFCIFDEENFKNTDMAKHGNRGFRCHEIITLRRVLTESE